MEKKKKESGKEVSRREFVKKMAYLAPAVATLIIPKYTAAQGCTGYCSNQCPPRCDPRCSGFCWKECTSFQPLLPPPTP